MTTSHASSALNIDPSRVLKPGTEPMGTSLQSKPSPSTERTRVQLDFSQDAYEQLNEMKRKAKAKSNVELTRNALRLYDWYLEKQDQGFELLLAKDGVIKQVELLL